LRIRTPGRRDASLLRSRGLKLAAPTALVFMDVASYQLGLLKPLVRRSFLEAHRLRFDPSLRVGEDFCFFVELLLVGARWIQLPDSYYVYARGHHSLTSDARRHVEGSIRFNRVLLTRPRVQAEPELVMLLQRREQFLEDFRRLLDVVALAHARDWPGIARLLTSDRRSALRLFRTAARHGYHKLVPYRLRRLKFSSAGTSRE